MLSELRSQIATIAHSPSLFEEKNFEKRAEAIDFLEFHVIDRIEPLLPHATHARELESLQRRAKKIKADLEEMDANLFQRLRKTIREAGRAGKAFKHLVSEYMDLHLYDTDQEEVIGYDNLDIFINGLFAFQPAPGQTRELEPEMVSFQKTPARVVFWLVEKCPFTKDDVFFDVGSGLGQVAILVNLLAGISVRGIELDPAFCGYARDCAARLCLSDVTFIHTDARDADYSEGTVFFMYTPFRGEIMETVSEILRKEALRRKIRIITYGPCTAQVASFDWLSPAFPETFHGLSLFSAEELRHRPLRESSI